MFILLVTWLVAGQPPSSYQVQFTSLKSCETAKAKVLDDADRMILAEAARQQKAAVAGGYRVVVPAEPPHVTAVCAAR